MSKKPEPRPEVTKTKPLAALDDRAQARAKALKAKYGWELYVYHDGPLNAGLDIVSANGPIAGDTRDWYVVAFQEGDSP